MFKKASLVRVIGLCLFIVALGTAFGVSAQEQVTISFWHHYNAQSPENETLNKVLIPAFEKQYPHIKVKAVPHEWDQLHKKILVSTSSNQLPDVARADIAWVPEFQKLNILVPLNQEMEDFHTVAEGLLEGPMATARVKGDYYGLALNTNTKILFYNKALFDRAGVSVPKTLDEFFMAARKLSKKTGRPIWGYAEPALAGWNICPFIWSNGGEITDPEYKVASGYLNSAQNVEIIQKLADLYRDGAMTGFSQGAIPLTDGYAQGRYGMILEGPWKFAELEVSYPQFNPVTAPMPAGKGGSVQVLGGEDIVMFKTAQKEAAWAFMRFMTSEYAQVEMAKVGQLPVNKKALESSVVRDNKNMLPFLEAIKTARPRPPVSTWPEIDKELTYAVTLSILGEKPVQESLEEAAKKIDLLLSRQ